jgi:hypothetical protein
MSWIKIEHSTPTKPEVSQLADILEIGYREAVGTLVDFWIWADKQSVDGHALSVTQKFINHVVGVEGFAEGLEKVGWLVDDGGTLSLPNFLDNNGDSEKKRALAQKRQSRKRNARSVTEALPDKSKSTDVQPLPLPTRAQELWKKMSSRPFTLGSFQPMANRFGWEVIVLMLERAEARGVQEIELERGRLEGYIGAMCSSHHAEGNGHEKSSDKELSYEDALAEYERTGKLTPQLQKAGLQHARDISSTE